MEPEKRRLLLFPAVLIYSRRHRFVDEANYPAIRRMLVAMMYPDGEKGKTSPGPGQVSNGIQELAFSRPQGAPSRSDLALRKVGRVSAGESKTAKEGREAKVEKAAFVAFGVFVAVSAAYVALLLC